MTHLAPDTILGLSLSVFTTLHVIISLIAIASGFIVVFGMLSSRPLSALTAIFLATTALTSLTGFLFPFKGITPSIITGIVSLVVLAGAAAGRYALHLAGSWRWIYAICSVLALWFNVFILIAQLFEKVPAIHALAPTQSEPPFFIAQFGAMVLFLILGILAARHFHPAPVSA
jgi:hypothetical protein